MSARIIDGTHVAERIWGEVGERVADFAAHRRRLKLAALMIGEPPASQVYARSQAKQCARMMIDYELVQLAEDVTAEAAVARIQQLNRDQAITGIMLHLPVPPHLEPLTLQLAIDPYKDVEGVTPANIGMVFYHEPIIAPCTALAAIELVRESGIQLRGAEAVVVGQSAVVGLPISTLLIQEFATVTGCHIATRDLPGHTRRADLLVVAVGKAGLITAEHVKPGAVVIDVGINRVETTDAQGKPTSRTVGDVDFDAVREVAGAITPVPGGVGPVTVTMLLRNTIEAARKQAERERAK